jgi:hypothetical protein
MLRILDLLGTEDDCVWVSCERWGVFGNGPDHRLEELSEGKCGLVCVELEIDDDVARVVHRSQHAMRTHACLASCVAKSFECGCPGLEVGDRVLDVKDGHRWNVRLVILDRYPRKLGFTAYPVA